MNMRALNYILVIGVVVVILSLKTRTEKFENNNLTRGEEELYKRIREELEKKTGQTGNSTCKDKIKLLDNTVYRNAYGAGRGNDCFDIATKICESTKPQMYKVGGKYFIPRHLSKTYKDAPLPTFTKLDCFDMHYGCCLHANKAKQ